MGIWFFPLFLYEILPLNTLLRIGFFGYTIVFALISSIRVIGDFFDNKNKFKIYLEDGDIFEGKIESYNQDIVELETEDNSVYLDRDRIVSIREEKESSKK
jgi:sRNA-binding regulator protein Hfq